MYNIILQLDSYQNARVLQKRAQFFLSNVK